MSKQDFDANKEGLMSLSNDVVNRPTKPVGTIVQEAEDLAVRAKSDIAALTKAGLDPVLVDTLTSRAGALRFKQSEWV